MCAKQFLVVTHCTLISTPTGIKSDTVPYPLRYSIARLKLQVDRSESDFRQDGIRSDVSHSATAHLGSMGWFPVFGWI